MEATTRYNYYEILEIPRSAAHHEVTAAYDRARLTYSGDNAAIYTIFSEQEARDLLVLIDEAYKVLGNKTLRGIYDHRLQNNVRSRDELTYGAIVEASKMLFAESKPEKAPLTYKVDKNIEDEINTRDNWDGNFLRKVREYKQFSVIKIGEITKINPFYISAIEEMDSGNLPAVVFVRGYVVQIAKALGLDDKKVADSYMKNFKNAVGK